ncbi:MAG: hypothetical protein IT480_02570 [Gammaproteobacteria bacterium]|nr:hypothetical protein [Gammaproteobacteria bacterium]
MIAEVAMRMRSRTSLLAALILCLLAFPARAIDPTVNTILDIVLQEMAPELKPAKPFVICLIDGGSVESCVESFTGQLTAQAKGLTKQEADKALAEAKKSLPFNVDSPEIKLVMEIVKAAMDGNWGTVLSKGGPYVARAVTCAVVVPPGLKSFGCPVIGYVIEHKASMLGNVLSRLKSQDVPGLVKILIAEFDPTIVCELIPDSALPAGAAELKSLGCSTIGQILGEGVKLAEAFAKLGIDLGDELVDYMTGGNDFQSYDSYYAQYWRPGYHYGTWVCLDTTDDGCKSGSSQDLYTKLAKAIYGTCWNYYDEHDHWEEDAKKVCNSMRTVFNNDVAGISGAMLAAAQVFYTNESAEAVPQAVGDWAKIGTVDPKAGFLTKCTSAMSGKFPFPPTTKKPPVTAWAHVCEAPAKTYVGDYHTAAKQVEAVVKKLESLGCKKSNLGATERFLYCSTYTSFEACKSAYDGKLPCTLDVNKADTALADVLLKQLGTKRCKILDEVKTAPCPKPDGTVGVCTSSTKILACSRPWKIEQCKTLVANLTANYPGTTLKCAADAAGLQAFAKLEGEASAIMNTLNGGSGPIGTKPGSGDGGGKAKGSAGSGSCKTTWDPLSIDCPGGEIQAQSAISLPVCKSDPNHDGADAPCQVPKLLNPVQADATVGGMYQGPFAGAGTKSSPPPPPAAGAAVLPPPAMSGPPVFAPPPAGALRTAPAADMPGCSAIAGSTGQYACSSREAYARCERLRSSGTAGVRACQLSEVTRTSAPPTLAPPPALGPPVLAPPPAGALRTAPAADIPGCSAIAGSIGQYTCSSREAYARCERLRSSGTAGVRACRSSR